MSQLPQDVEEFIAERSLELSYGRDSVMRDVRGNAVSVYDLRAWMSGHVRVPAPKFQLGDNVWVNFSAAHLADPMAGLVYECRISKVQTSHSVEIEQEPVLSHTYQVIVVDDVYQQPTSIEAGRIHRTEEAARAASQDALASNLRSLETKMEMARALLNASKGE